MTHDPSFIDPEEHALALGAGLPAETPRKELAKRGLELSLAWDDVTARDSNGRTPLHNAAHEGQQELAEVLLARGADVNAKDKYGYAPLHLAASQSHNEMTALLLNNGASVHSKSNGGWTPLHRVSSVDVATTLLAHGASSIGYAFLRKTSPFQWDFPAKWAVANGHLDVLRLYVERASGIDIQPLYSFLCHNALHHAPSVEMAAFILEQRVPRYLCLSYHQPSVNARNEYGETPLHLAVLSKNFDLAAFLISNGAHINASTLEDLLPQQRPLLWARSFNVREIGKGDSFLTPILSGTPLHYARDVDALTFLLSRGADPGLTDSSGRNALQTAVVRGSVSNVEALLSGGADSSELINRDTQGKTLLHYAPTPQMGAFLLSKGVDVNNQDAAGKTALMEAIEKYCSDLVELLLERGANPNLCNNLGNSPLHAAAYAGYRAIAESLIGAGASVSAVNREGYTPLHCAAHGFDDGEVADLLIARGADINARDNDNNTPLHLLACTCLGDCDAIVKMLLCLLAHGADPNARDGEGFTLLEMSGDLPEGAVEILESLVSTSDE